MRRCVATFSMRDVAAVAVVGGVVVVVDVPVSFYAQSSRIVVALVNMSRCVYPFRVSVFVLFVLF